MNKYKLICTQCGKVIPDFATWFSQNQQCSCGCNRAEVIYSSDYQQIVNLLETPSPANFYHYFDFLPLLDRKNIITCNEGTIPIEEWSFLEAIAKEKYGINCKVMIYRNDLNGGTNTFKDVAASLAASIFKENGVKEFCIASTGNTATAYSRYLSLAGIPFTVFVPDCVCEDTVEAIRAHGQNVVVCNGDYAFAKKKAAEFHERHHVMISAGNIDPIRVEAKKTMVFEFLRQMGKMPDIYMQAVSGGTGPIAVDKGVRELQPHFPNVQLPRLLLVQQDTCAPMVQAWNTAKQNHFPDGYHTRYPVIENPQTMVSILSTGNPGMFPIVAPLVKKSGGTFLQVKESQLVDFARIVKKERDLYLGPASIVCLAGFYQALEEHEIHDGNTVLINTGEGAARASHFVDMINQQ